MWPGETRPLSLYKQKLKYMIKKQYKVGDKVKYDNEKHLIVNILENGDLVLVPMSIIDDECYAVETKEIE